MAVFFNGRLWITPATMSLVDDSAMVNRNLNVGNRVVFIGRSEGGEPFKPLSFGSYEQARAVLRSGETLKAIEKAFDPSPETVGPSEVVFVRVNPAVQSSLALKDASNATVVNLLSEGFGRFTNGIKVKVESGSVRGKKLTTQFGNDYYSSDNVARDLFSLSYSGGGAATVSVTASSLVLSVGGSPVATVSLDEYATVYQLVDRINTVASFSASVLDGNGELATPNALDYLSGQSISGTITVTANLQACIDWFNSVGEGFVSASRPATAGTQLANIPFAYLSGGSDGEVTTSEWQDAFDALHTVDVQWVCPISSLPAIHAMADSHCTFMSNIARMERRALCGTALGVSDADAIAAAKALNSDRSSLVHLGFYDYNEKGKLTLYPPYLTAALLAGAFAGVNPGTPLTNKAIKVRGLERDLRNPTDTDALITGGVLCVENTNTGYKVVQSITTWLVNDNYNRVEISTGVAVDYVSRSVRNAVDALRGTKGSPLSLSDAASRVDTVLRELARPEPMGPGVIVGDKENPAYKNIVVSLEGDVLRIEFQCSPVIPINYIPIVIHAVPYSGTVTI